MKKCFKDILNFLSTHPLANQLMLSKEKLEEYIVTGNIPNTYVEETLLKMLEDYVVEFEKTAFQDKTSYLMDDMLLLDINKFIKENYMSLTIGMEFHETITISINKKHLTYIQQIAVAMGIKNADILSMIIYRVISNFMFADGHED
ncbi:MAG: hypothetical protein FJZ11_03885 [Candidatus Omnitrophica bacterium]|nr:hypothetical protein [Candidatus Omnitrophota bacterium]